MENIKIQFSKIPDVKKEDLEKIQDSISRAKKEKTEKIPGEYEKTQEELHAIDIVNDLIKEELKELGIEVNENLTEDRVHFVNQKIADDLEIKATGRYTLDAHRIIINKDKTNNRYLRILKTLLHEALHYYSIHLLLGTVENGSDVIKERRCGYHLKKSPDQNGYHNHFRGLNEAITEKLTGYILKKNRYFLTKEFKLEETKFGKEGIYRYGYPKEIEILDFIIKKISEFYKKDPEEIWTQFKKGLFTGEMMHLREIEKVFGPGSLRILAIMTSAGFTENFNEEEAFDKIKKFFEEENEEKRNEIAKEILPNREYLQYEKRNKKN